MVRLLVTFMQQRLPPAGEPLAAPLPGVDISEEKLPVPDYLALYRAVGEAVLWDERLLMPEPELDAFLRDDSTILFVLTLNGERVGLLEAVTQGKDIEIAHFGLAPAAQGKRLGPHLLDFGLRSLWEQGPERIWLHTDTNDHPNAVRTYERAGFAVVERRWMEFPD